MFSSSATPVSSIDSIQYAFSPSGSSYRSRTISDDSDSTSTDENGEDRIDDDDDTDDKILYQNNSLKEEVKHYNKSSPTISPKIIKKKKKVQNLVKLKELKAALPLLRRLKLDRKECWRLSIIDMNHQNIIPEEVPLIAPFLRETLHLQVLKLSFNRLGDEGAKAFATALHFQKTLLHLDLGFNGIGDEGAVALSHALGSNQIIKALCLSGNKIGELGAKALGDGLRMNDTLQVLHLSGNSITEKGVCYLGDSLMQNKALLKLYLSGSAMGDVGAASLARAIEASPPTTRPVTPVTCLGAEEVEDGGVSEMTTIMNSQSISAQVTGIMFDQRAQQGGGLEWLYVSQNHIGDAGIDHLAKALTSNRGLRAIELGFNKITPLGIEVLSGALRGYTCLMYLHLDNNTMGCQGAYHLAQVLDTTKIQLLDVGFNKIGQEGIKALMKAVCTNKCLSVLVLSGNKFTLEAAQAVADAVEKNTVLKELYMDHTEMNLLCQSFIVSGLVNNRALGLRQVTGFLLGEVAISVHVPALINYAQTAPLEIAKQNKFLHKSQTSSIPPACLEECSNEIVLNYIRGMWYEYEQASKEAEEEEELAELGCRNSLPPPSSSQNCESSSSSSSSVAKVVGESSGDLQFGDLFEDMDSSGEMKEDIDDDVKIDDEVKVELDRISTLPHSASELRELSCYFFNGYSGNKSTLKGFDSLEFAPPLKRSKCGVSGCQIYLYPKILTKLESLRESTSKMDEEILPLLRKLKYLEYMFAQQVPRIEKLALGEED